MDWRQYIHSNNEILSGKPVVKGTRIAVDFILNLFVVGSQDAPTFPVSTKVAHMGRDSIRECQS